MNGYIKLESDVRDNTEGISVDVNLEQVGLDDKILLLNSFCDALDIDPVLVRIFSDMYFNGVFDNAVDVENIKE